MTDIATRAEAAAPEEARGLLLELALLVHADKPVFHLGRDAFPDFWPWTNRFRRLLDIYTPEAHLAAAMMLMKPGQSYILDVSADGICAAMLRPDGDWCYGDNEALALIAAIARSIEP